MAILTADKVASFFEHGAPVKLDVKVAPRFKAGDHIRGKNIHPKGHCRLPRYLRGKKGEIIEDQGVFIFADTNATGRNQKPQHLYTVRFTHEELWGADASPRDSVVITLYDDHMDHV